MYKESLCFSGKPAANNKHLWETLPQILTFLHHLSLCRVQWSSHWEEVRGVQNHTRDVCMTSAGLAEKRKKNITITAALHYSVMKYNNAFYKKKCALSSRKPGPVCKLTSSPSKLLQLQGGVWLTVGYVLQFKLQLLYKWLDASCSAGMIKVLFVTAPHCTWILIYSTFVFWKRPQ